MVITPDGQKLGRSKSEATFQAIQGATDDFIKDIHGIALIAELDDHEIG